MLKKLKILLSLEKNKKIMFFKNKQVTITGGSGFVGTHFLEELIKQNANIKIILNVNSPKINIKNNNNIKVFYADLNDQNQCQQALKDSEYVIHAAGAASGAAITTGASKMNPMSSIIKNLYLTAQVIEASWTVGVKSLLIFSSSTVYPVTNYPVKESDMWTGDPHISYLGYGWMRRYIEKLCEFASLKSKLNIALIRPTAIYGPWDDYNPMTSHVLPALIKRAMDKENPFIVWGSGEEIRDFLYVKDLIKGSLLALEKFAICEPINIGYGSPIKIKDLIQIILEETNHQNCDLVFDKTKPQTIPVRMVDTLKAKNKLNFYPDFSLRDGIKQTINWYKNYFKK